MQQLPDCRHAGGEAEAEAEASQVRRGGLGVVDRAAAVSEHIRTNVVATCFPGAFLLQR